MRSDPDGGSSEPWTRRKLLVTIAALVLVVAAGALLMYRSADHEWPWSTDPNVLHACGRDFVPLGEPATRAGWVARGAVLVRVPGDVQGMFNHGALWATDSTPGRLPGGCQMEIWVQSGADEFKQYELSGGP